MIVVKPSFEILSGLEPWTLTNLEKYGRVCYKSECRISEGTAETFVKSILSRQHESVIEHEAATVRIICDRGVSHELVRHRIASYSQESTRYVNYAKEQQPGVIGEIQVIEPPGLNMIEKQIWTQAMKAAEANYQSMIAAGAKPQIARSVLPHSTKTEVVVTMNLRSWRNFFKLRTPKSAHPQMREIAIPMLRAFQARVPIIFDDIQVQEEQ